MYLPRKSASMSATAILTRGEGARRTSAMMRADLVAVTFKRANVSRSFGLRSLRHHPRDATEECDETVTSCKSLRRFRDDRLPVCCRRFFCAFCAFLRPNCLEGILYRSG